MGFFGLGKKSSKPPPPAPKSKPPATPLSLDLFLPSVSTLKDDPPLLDDILGSFDTWLSADQVPNVDIVEQHRAPSSSSGPAPARQNPFLVTPEPERAVPSQTYKVQRLGAAGTTRNDPTPRMTRSASIESIESVSMKDVRRMLTRDQAVRTATGREYSPLSVAPMNLDFVRGTGEVEKQSRSAPLARSKTFNRRAKAGGEGSASSMPASLPAPSVPSPVRSNTTIRGRGQNITRVSSPVRKNVSDSGSESSDSDTPIGLRTGALPRGRAARAARRSATLSKRRSRSCMDAPERAPLTSRASSVPPVPPVPPTVAQLTTVGRASVERSRTSIDRSRTSVDRSRSSLDPSRPQASRIPAVGRSGSTDSGGSAGDKKSNRLSMSSDRSGPGRSSSNIQRTRSIFVPPPQFAPTPATPAVRSSSLPAAPLLGTEFREYRGEESNPSPPESPSSSPSLTPSSSASSSPVAGESAEPAKTAAPEPPLADSMLAAPVLLPLHQQQVLHRTLALQMQLQQQQQMAHFLAFYAAWQTSPLQFHELAPADQVLWWNSFCAHGPGTSFTAGYLAMDPSASAALKSSRSRRREKKKPKEAEGAAEEGPAEVAGDSPATQPGSEDITGRKGPWDGTPVMIRSEEVLSIGTAPPPLIRHADNLCPHPDPVPYSAIAYYNYHQDLIALAYTLNPIPKNAALDPAGKAKVRHEPLNCEYL
ncbi:hypothetical protein BDK51DRAFT_49367 [Blyttiomyces helicus]|uniref:Uncharacterized protein n=1 Tax=Blyttiomyces helicus TaxID=388810 RepID=A0A4P9W8N3_9FUNG|nr:hypothetical protein BDK51DRAFT_49367 [Blyttiomyces helicus]|eukprot:RKO86526.1 hypothetical protein BDK51DRAFT_49367 [Blyttiomyces helicus]